MPAIAFAALEWTVVPMPGGNGPVQLARLPDLQDGAFRAFVRFPAGWERPQAGHYLMPEEFFVLDGDLQLNGESWRSGGYAWIPGGKVREQTRSDAGCLAYAWFASRPRWRVGASSETMLKKEVSFDHWRSAPALFGDNAYALREGPEHRTWLIERVTPQLTIKLGPTVEVLSLADCGWHWNVTGIHGIAVPLLVRVPAVRREEER